jgi:hypothetical protein
MESMWQEVSGLIWNIMWIRTDDTRWCVDLIWGALSLDQLWSYAVMI